MIHFRCYFIGEDGHIRAAEDLSCESEADAIVEARRAFARRSDYFGFEIWCGSRKLHREARAAPIRRAAS